MEKLLLVLIPAVCAGLIQGVTGFGAGIVMMIFLPMIFPVVASAGISQSICLVLTFMMFLRYRKYANLKLIAWPAVIFLVISSICMQFSQYVNQNLMKLILGIFLLLLSIWFLFLARDDFHPKGIVSFLCVAISGMCDGLFGVGGPLMVVLFLSRTESKEEYLGTIQSFFLLTVLYAVGFRFMNGLLPFDAISYILIGIVGVLSGLVIANKIVERINGELLKKLTYVLIGISGIINVITVLL